MPDLFDEYDVEALDALTAWANAEPPLALMAPDEIEWLMRSLVDDAELETRKEGGAGREGTASVVV